MSLKRERSGGPPGQNHRLGVEPARILVIPAYQAACTVAQVVTSLIGLGRAQGRELRVLVIDDGSTDATGELAQQAGALVIRHPRNRGKGAALRTGLAWALRFGAKQVVTLDADGQHPAEEALRLAFHPAPPEALVLGVRDLVAARAPRANRFSNSLSNFFLSRLGGRSLRDTHCGLRRYPVVETLSLGAWSDGFDYEAEVVLRAARAGWQIEQVPVRVYYPPSGKPRSHFHPVRDPAKVVFSVLVTLAAGSGRNEQFAKKPPRLSEAGL